MLWLNKMIKRVIVDYRKLDPPILKLLSEKFKDNDYSDIISFRNSKNEVIEALELRTEDTIYLVKVGTKLVEAIEDFEADINDNDLTEFY